MSDYNTREILQEKFLCYKNWEFEKYIFNMMIPDVIPYIEKTFTCFSYAIRCREIIDDICNQIVEYRKEHSVICLSVEYHVGSLVIDGNSFAQQNIQQYCHYISEVTDCLCQIMNIVFNLGYSPWEKFDAVDILKALNKKKLNEITKLCKNYNEKIKTHKDIDNFNKHNLSITVNEKLSSDCIKKVKYKITTLKNKYALDDIINQSVESDIINATMELLDKIFESASDIYNTDRLYVKNVNNNNIEDYNCLNKAVIDTKIISLNFDNKNNCSIDYNITEEHKDIICLADLHKHQKDSLTELSISTLNENKIDVMQNGKIIGKYECVDTIDKDAYYFHFKKFEYKAIE